MHRMSFALACALAALVAGAPATATAQEKAAKSKPAPAVTTPVNLNTATAADLQALPGVGAATARLIIEHREKNGGFKKIEELMNIKGIGEKSFLKLKPMVTVAPQKAERQDDAGRQSVTHELGCRRLVPSSRGAGASSSVHVHVGVRRLGARSLLALAMSVTMAALAMALTSSAIDEMRTAVAARYVAGRIGSTRIDAVRRASAVALRFEAVDGDYMYAPYEDGNGNGVRTAEIRAGIDRPLGPFERLGDKFPGVRFELAPGAPDADGQTGTGADGVRIGSARLLTMSADGTATSGTLYVRGRRGQYAVRVLGVTGRTRMLQYSAGNRTWLSR